MSSMQFAGHMIDQQTGVSLGEIFNPELGSSSTLSGELLHWLGMAAFLSVGGHLLVVRTLVESYHGLPLGHAWVPQSMFELLRGLVTQSLVLTIQIAAPVGISMISVGLAMGYMGHAIPQLNVLIIGFPVRTLGGFVILMLALSRMVEALLRPFPELLEQFLAACGGRRSGGARRRANRTHLFLVRHGRRAIRGKDRTAHRPPSRANARAGERRAQSGFDGGGLGPRGDDGDVVLRPGPVQTARRDCCASNWEPLPGRRSIRCSSRSTSRACCCRP